MRLITDVLDLDGLAAGDERAVDGELVVLERDLHARVDGRCGHRERLQQAARGVRALSVGERSLEVIVSRPQEDRVAPRLTGGHRNAAVMVDPLREGQQVSHGDLADGAEVVFEPSAPAEADDDERELAVHLVGDVDARHAGRQLGRTAEAPVGGRVGDRVDPVGPLRRRRAQPAQHQRSRHRSHQPRQRAKRS